MTIEKPIGNKRAPAPPTPPTPPPSVEDDAFDDVWADLRDAKRDEFYLRGLLQRSNESAGGKKTDPLK